MADVTDLLYAGEAMIGYGAQFLVGQDDGSPETFSAVPDVMTITPGDWTTGVIPKTHLRSPDRHHEKLATIRDSGAFTIEGNYRPTHGAHQTEGGDGFSATANLPYLWVNVVEANFKIILPDAGVPVSPDTMGEVLEFRGVITKYQIGQVALEDLIPFTLEVTPLRAFTLP
jgi:hypothetical protein